jgi:hypothetical protein
MYTGETVVESVQDPSLFSTIVVTGLPMGEDNHFVTITRSDVLNTGYGINTMTTSDVVKYGQSVEYPMALLRQNVPVKLLRVTPDDATYAVAAILVQWRVDDDRKKFEVRFKIATETQISSAISDLSAYKNTNRLHNALVKYLKNSDIPTGWDGQDVLMTIISAGRGSAYNRMRFFINQTEQQRKQSQVRYNFGTIDTLNNLTVENFTASLVNDENVNNTYNSIYNNSGAVVDTVNLAVSKRMSGSSVLVPTVNESAVKTVYAAYKAYFEQNRTSGYSGYANYGKAYDEIYNTLSVANFDIFYGMFTYKDSTFELPFYQVDMTKEDVPRLEESHRVDTDVNEFTSHGGTVTANVITSGVDTAIPAILYDKVIAPTIADTFNDNNSPAPGDVYITGKNTENPSLAVITGVNMKNGAVESLAFNRLWQIDSSTKEFNKSITSKGIKSVITTTGNIWFSIQESGEDFTPFLKRINDAAGAAAKFTADDIIVVTGIYKGNSSSYTQFHIYKVNTVDTAGKITGIIPYPHNIYAAIDYSSSNLKNNVYSRIALKSCENDTDKNAAYSRVGALWIDDVSTDMIFPEEGQAKPANLGTSEDPVYPTTARILGYFDASGNPVWFNACFYADYKNASDDHKDGTPGTHGGHTTIFKAFQTLPSGIAVAINTEIVGDQYDVIVKTAFVSGTPIAIYRCNVQNAIINTYRVTYAAEYNIPANYYSEYGDAIYSENGGIPVILGSSGFFDDNISDIEFKWRYSALLVRAFRGEIDPRILSPVRIPAKFLFDGAFNTVVGMNVLPYTVPSVEDTIYASTIFTEDEKEEVLYDKSILNVIRSYEDIDVKQAMYDLMITRVYQRIPEDKRPVGPGFGLSLHLDAGITDAETAVAVNNSFKNRFDNPNASWDIGGYVSAANGVSYTYIRKIVDDCFNHFRNFTINKPFVGDYSMISKNDYVSFFPDLDATDWEMRELYYQSGGNAWIMDENGNLTRRSQRTLYREETGTSDLYQESNMRTLTQLCYLIQEEIDHYLLEYNDDGVIKTMQETVNNKFAGWVGNLVSSLDIQFRRDYNTDGGEILVCEVNVAFRGLILRVPIIVNVNRRSANY